MSPEPPSVTSAGYGGVRIKEEQREEPTDRLEEHVQVKEEQEWLGEFERDETETANGDVKQEIGLLKLYAGHKVEPGLVLGPEGTQPPDSTFQRPLCGDPRTATAGSRVTVCDPHSSMPTKSTECNTLIRHRQKPTLKREKLYSCDMCLKKYTNKYTLNTHRKTHTDPGKTYYCDLCVRHFTTQMNLNSHMQSHMGVKLFSCKVCMKHFSYKCTLKAHIQTHTISKKYSCDICMKKFTTSSSFKKHRHTHISHTEVKAFYCDMCMKMFIKKNSLIIHLQTHCRDKPYTCSICDRQFMNKKYFHLHVRNHEGVGSPLSCAFCLKQFKQKNDLIVHSRTHTGKIQHEDFNVNVNNLILYQ